MHCSQSNGKHGRGVCVWRHGAITRNVSVFSTKVHLEGQENQASKRRQHTCFQCKKAGHIKVIYPLLNNDKFKKKKKARCATWDDIDNETKNEVINKKTFWLWWFLWSWRWWLALFWRTIECFQELHDAMASLCTKNIELKRKLAIWQMNPLKVKKTKQNWRLRIWKMKMKS